MYFEMYNWKTEMQNRHKLKRNENLELDFSHEILSTIFFSLELFYYFFR